MSFLSTLTASIPVLPWTQWHTRRFQYCLLSQWNHSFQIPNSIWQYFPWWTQESNLSKDRPISPENWIIVISDASLQGWEPIVGTWRPREHGTLWFLVVPNHWSWENPDIPTSHTGSENHVIDGQQKQEKEKKSLHLLQLTADTLQILCIGRDPLFGIVCVLSSHTSEHPERPGKLESLKPHSMDVESHIYEGNVCTVANSWYESHGDPVQLSSAYLF